ncbi:DgyrCDS6667 [Dimorphilus gyrociliatus]|uniref:XK-related protein n=1 Tax=Dimorphilus gyrociliatus TaxID=2664684 RepID=A0A7I8VNP2_9ANNE|nr:DgyrCDS6667 [Dimorphilus gyrociliatus]
MAPPLPKLPQTRCKKYEKLAKLYKDNSQSEKKRSIRDASDGRNLNFSIKETIIEEENEVFCDVSFPPRTASNCSPYPGTKIRRTKTNFGKKTQQTDSLELNGSETDSCSVNQRDLSLGAEAGEFFTRSSKEGTLESLKRFPSVSSADPTPRSSLILPTSGSVPLLESSVKEPHHATLPTIRFTNCDFLISLTGILFYFFDVASDVFVAVLYFMNGKIWWFVLTVIFIVGPSLVSSAFSLYWYYVDYKKLMICGDEEIIKLEKPSKKRWFCRIFCVILQFGPVLRYIDTIYYGCKSRRSKGRDRLRAIDMMLYEDVDASMLKLFECFLESAPQLVFQLYVLTQVYGTDHVIFMIGQFFSIVLSIGSLAWSLTAYFRALRISQPERKSSVTECGNAFPGIILQFGWRYFTIGTRVLAMALFASAFTWYIFVFCGVHYVIVLTWILYQNTSFFQDEKGERRRCAEFFFDVVVAWIHLYCFFNVTEGHTRLRYAMFYTLVYIENLILTFFWFISSQTNDLPYHLPALLVVVLGFWIGITFMLLYYLRFHPNDYPLVHEGKKIRCWIPCSELIHNEMHDVPIQDHGVKKKDRVSISDDTSVTTFERRERIDYTAV